MTLNLKPHIVGPHFFAYPNPPPPWNRPHNSYAEGLPMANTVEYSVSLTKRSTPLSSSIGRLGSPRRPGPPAPNTCDEVREAYRLRGWALNTQIQPAARAGHW